MERKRLAERIRMSDGGFVPLHGIMTSEGINTLGSCKSMDPMECFDKYGGGISPALDEQLSNEGKHTWAGYGHAHGGVVRRQLADRMASKGGKVPGRAKHPGDHDDNDIVDSELSPGEIVLPRSVTKSKHPVENSAKFVQKELQKGSKNG